MIKVLITGITGFVGSHLADYFLEHHPEVGIFGLVRWRSPIDNIEHVIDRINLVWADLEDASSLYKRLDEIRPDVVMHLAAQSYVSFSFTAPMQTMMANVVGTCNLLESIKILRERCNKFNPTIHICSSSEVYGQVEKHELPIKESNPLRPCSPYAVSKVAEDMLGFQYFTSWGLKTIRTRAFTHTGPRRGAVFVCSTFAKQIAMIEKGLQKPVIKVGNLDSVRTFLDVKDIVRAYWMVVERCVPGEVYNIGGEESMTVGDMLKKLMAISDFGNIRVKVDPSRLRPSDVTMQIPDVSKFKKATGWKPEIPFDKTINNILEYWRDNV